MFSSCCGLSTSYFVSETGGHGFHDIADSVLSHSNFGVPDICSLRTIYNAQIERPRVFYSLGSLRQPELKEPHWIGFSTVGVIHNLWCSSSPNWQTASRFGWTFEELYDFSAMFLLSYHEVLHVRVVVFLATTQATFFSQIFKVHIGQYFAIEIPQLTVLPQGRLLFWC